MANQIAQYWAADLPESHRKVLYDALCILTDDFLGDNEHIDSLIAYFLPQKYSLQYTGIFLRRFFTTLLTVGYKLAQANQVTIRLKEKHILRQFHPAITP